MMKKHKYNLILVAFLSLVVGGVIGYCVKFPITPNLEGFDWNVISNSTSILIGFGVGLFSDLVKTNSQLKHKASEIIFTKRVKEIDQIIEVINKTKFSVSIRQQDEKTPQQKCHQILTSKENLVNICADFNKILSRFSIWLSRDLYNDIEDLNLYIHDIKIFVVTEKLDDNDLKKLGNRIFDDFDYFQQKINKSIRNYMNTLPKGEFVNTTRASSGTQVGDDLEKHTIFYSKIFPDELKNTKRRISK